MDYHDISITVQYFKALHQGNQETSDTIKALSLLKSHNPFSGFEGLQNIIHGIEAKNEVNMDNSKEVGMKVHRDMTRKNIN